MNDNPPVCVPCRLDMICDQNGVLLVQFLEHNEPLTAVFADLFRCRQCGAQVIANRADQVVWNRASGFPLNELGGLRSMKMYSTLPYGAGNIFDIHFNEDGSIDRLPTGGGDYGVRGGQVTKEKDMTVSPGGQGAGGKRGPGDAGGSGL